MRQRIATAGIVLVAAAWLTAVWAAALITPRSGRTAAGVSAAVFVAGSLVCHQRPDRSFHVNGVQLPVCARCLGLYAGGFLGAAAWALVSFLRKPSRDSLAWMPSTHIVRPILIAAAVPTLVSVALGAIGVWEGTNALRAVLAVPLGAAIGATVTAVAAGDLR